MKSEGLKSLEVRGFDSSLEVNLNASLLEWQQINSFATWFSAGGSKDASFLALYLSRQSNVEKLNIDYAFGTEADGKKYLEVRLTNIGVRPINLRLCSILTPKTARIGGGIGADIRLQYGDYHEIKFLMEDLLKYSSNRTVIEVDTTTKRFSRKLPKKTLKIGNSISIE